MKKLFFLLFIVYCSLFTVQCFCQVKNVEVETYYISDATDAKDTTGGILEPGSTTYRIYLKLAKGSILKKIYGDKYHALKFSSTALFFNNSDRPASFGYEVNDKYINQNTVALDSWITLGMATKKRMGVLKSEDTDGSIVSGSNRSDSLLKNNNSKAGIPLTKADGLMLADSVPGNWASNGFINDSLGVDTTIFGEINKGLKFISNNCSLQNSGVSGMSSENEILVAQLTTKGELSFELNVEIEQHDSSGTKTEYYVAVKGNDSASVKLCPQLKYPPLCGCSDPNYIEFKTTYSCNIQDSCKNKIMYGCMDPMACNYDPKANYNIPDLCCYPGSCNDRDISLICPNLGSDGMKLKLYPNPAKEILDIEITLNSNDEAKYIIYDYLGREMMAGNETLNSDNNIHQADISKLNNGLYFFRIFCKNGQTDTKIFIKN